MLYSPAEVLLQDFIAEISDAVVVTKNSQAKSGSYNTGALITAILSFSNISYSLAPQILGFRLRSNLFGEVNLHGSDVPEKSN